MYTASEADQVTTCVGVAPRRCRTGLAGGSPAVRGMGEKPIEHTTSQPTHTCKLPLVSCYCQSPGCQRRRWGRGGSTTSAPDKANERSRPTNCLRCRGVGHAAATVGALCHATTAAGHALASTDCVPNAFDYTSTPSSARSSVACCWADISQRVKSRKHTGPSRIKRSLVTADREGTRG